MKTRLFCLLAMLTLGATGAVLTRTPRHENALRTRRPVAHHYALSSAELRVARIRGSYGRLPIRFEANRGQTDARVKLIERGGDHTLFLTPAEAIISLRQAGAPALLRIRFAGANPSAAVVGRDALPARSNYFIGHDPAAWVIGVPNYARAEYRQIYRGIDLSLHGYQGSLEFDFRVAPGADPGVIRLAFPGVDKVEIEAGGDLLLHAGATVFRQRRPRVYQQADRGRREIDARYELDQSRQVHIALGRYDRGRELVIDPVLSYSTYLGGNGSDAAYSIAVDSKGSAYVAGQTLSTNFPLHQPLQAKCGGGCVAGSTDVFVSKFSADGRSLIYSTYLGGNNMDLGFGIAVDALGNAYVTGSTASGDFPATPHAFQNACQSHACGSGFVTKLNAAGNGLVYSTFLGGSLPFDQGNAIAVDGKGNAYVTGTTGSGDFPTTPGAFDRKCGTDGACNGFGIGDAFVTKLSADGAALIYSTYLGGSSSEQGNGVAVDALGGAYVTGGTFSPDFPTTPGAFQRRLSGGSLTDAFVTRLKPDGSGLVYSTYLGGDSYDVGHGIAVDSQSNAYVAGDTSSDNFPTTPGAFDQRPPIGVGTQSAFVTKLNPAGSVLVYSTHLGGPGDSGLAIALNATGNAYVTGRTSSRGFPTQSPLQATCGTCPLSETAYVTKFNGKGSMLIFSTFLGGTFADGGQGIAVDFKGDAYITGFTVSRDFPTTPGAFQTANGGPLDAFVAKMSGLALPLATLPLEPLNFPGQLIGTTSAPQKVMLTNDGDAALVISDISISGGFAQTNTCGASVAAGASCTLSVTFKPNALGLIYGTLTIADNAAGSPHQVSMNGIGISSPTSTATRSPTPTRTPTPTIRRTATKTPTPTATATVLPGPHISSIPAIILVGDKFDIVGSGFTAGSDVQFFVATAQGPAGNLFAPDARTSTRLTINLPDTLSLGEGFAALNVLNRDQGLRGSNFVYALLQGDPAHGIPTIKTINGVGLAATSSDPNFAVNNVETVVPQGTTVKLGGTGFDTVHGVAVDLFCPCPPHGKVGPFYIAHGAPGLTTTQLSFTVPAKGLPNSPPTGPGSFVVSNAGPAAAYIKKSNAVSVPIGAKISVSSVGQLGSTITVNGTGFSTLTVINFFNTQAGGKVVNLGGLKPDGTAAIPLAFVNDTKFTFTKPTGAAAGASYVQAINPPFVPYTASGSGPGGAFTLH